MTLNVRDLLNMPELKGIRVLAGEKGLDRSLLNVNVIEAPDISRWLHGGELVLTSAYLFRDQPERLLSLVNEINSVGAAAMAIKLGRFIHELPEEAKQAADACGLPILELPIRLAFADVITTVLTRITNEQAGNIRFSEMVLRSFSTLLVEGGGIDQVLYNLQLFTREDVAFIGLSPLERHVSARSQEFKDLVRDETLRFLQDRFHCEKIGSNQMTFGYLVIGIPSQQQPLDRQLHIAISHAATALQLCVQRDIAAREVERRYRDEFVQDLILNNVRYQREVGNRANRFGWDLSGWGRAIIVDIDEYKRRWDSATEFSYARLEEGRQQIFSIAVTTLRQASPRIPYTTMSDSIVFLDFSHMGNPLRIHKSHLERLQAEVSKRTDFTVSIAVGRFKEGCFLCHESYNEAKKALSVFRTLRGNSQLMISWDDLGIFSFLAPICDSDDAKRFCEEHLSPLIEFDRLKNADLMLTLETIIKHNWQLKLAAQALSIHYNTLRYRYEKIRDLLHMDLNDSDERLNLAIAFKMYAINQNPNT